MSTWLDAAFACMVTTAKRRSQEQQLLRTESAATGFVNAKVDFIYGCYQA
jgi:hypothetical protein